MAETEHNIILIGGPQAGKTSFLAKLWLDIESRGGEFILSERPPDEEYLRTISTHILEGEYPPRTPLSESAVCEIKVTVSNSEVRLAVPDQSGEMWNELYSRREWPESLENMIDEHCACLIFLRATEFVELIDWVTAGYQSDDETVGSSTGPVPTEVITVEWLQMLHEAFKRRLNMPHRPRIAIVFSAWDELPTKYQQSANRYIQSDFKMLDQFLENNEEQFSFGLFALSTTGGDLHNKTFKQKFLENPQAYGYLRTDAFGTPTVEDRPLTDILKWCIDTGKN